MLLTRWGVSGMQHSNGCTDRQTGKRRECRITLLFMPSLLHYFSLSLWLYSSLAIGRFFCFLLFLYTVGRTPWTGDQLVARPLPTHKQRMNVHRHPCLDWDPNPRPQSSSGRRRFMPHTARPLWAALHCLLRTKYISFSVYMRTRGGKEGTRKHA
jgi:hypothetical protein